MESVKTNVGVYTVSLSFLRGNRNRSVGRRSAVAMRRTTVHSTMEVQRNRETGALVAVATARMRGRVCYLQLASRVGGSFKGETGVCRPLSRSCGACSSKESANARQGGRPF